MQVPVCCPPFVETSVYIKILQFLQAAKTDYDKNDIQPGAHYSGAKSAQETPPLKYYDW